MYIFFKITIRWVISFGNKTIVKHNKETQVEYDGVWSVDTLPDNIIKRDNSLLMRSPGHHHAISSRFIRPFHFAIPSSLNQTKTHSEGQLKRMRRESATFVVQYEARLFESLRCGGAYIKLLVHSSDLDVVSFLNGELIQKSF